MTIKVFIGGSRRVSRLDAPVRVRLDKIVEKGLPVIIGDANGADKAVQQYLFSKHYDKVEVFLLRRGVQEQCRPLADTAHRRGHAR